MPVWGLPDHLPFFPHPFTASEEGLLAIGENLTTEQIVMAYSFGLFPWSNEGDPIMWWFTTPRCVLFPEKIKVSKSMRRFLKGTSWRITENQAFERVIRACKEIKRPDQGDTWIHEELLYHFLELHHRGLAQSVEVWDDNNRLVGGLYGLFLGKIFFGESMFSRASNASKMALIHLARRLESENGRLIDCQQTTDHLISMGAEEIDRDEWWRYLKANQKDILLEGHRTT